MANADKELLNLDEAARFLGISRPTIYRLLGQGELKGLKAGRQWRFRLPDLTAYLERGPVALAAAPDAHLDVELSVWGAATDQLKDGEAKTARLADEIVRAAINARASDIHLEPAAEAGESFLRLRLRVDGVLQEARRMPTTLHDSLIARFKTRADMNVAERRVPQDGRFRLEHDGKNFDLRLNTTPVLGGESLVMRILDRTDVLIGLDKLGLTPEHRTQIDSFLRLPNGLILIAGPSGSGKTTFAYSCLQQIAASEKKTLTVENPVELQLPHITQAQVNARVGMTFPNILRSLMRQDPDVIFSGEAREPESAGLLVEAALTGHLVFSILHAGGAGEAVMRLLDLGIEPYLLAGTLKAIVAPRLCRRLCAACKGPVAAAADPGLDSLLALAASGGYAVPADVVFFQGRGCDRCRQRGYRGRIGLFEIMAWTPALTDALLAGTTAEELNEIAVTQGMKTLIADGVGKAVMGETTLDEVRRVTYAAA